MSRRSSVNIKDRTSTKYRVLAVTAAALLGGLTACGGAPAADTGSTAPETLTKITVQTPPFAFEAVEMAQRHGIFKKHGLEVESSYGSGEASKQIPKVLSGEVNFVLSAAADVIRASEKGLPVVITGGAQASSKEGDSTDGLLVPPASPIDSFKDLEGKKVGLAGLGNLPQILVNIAMKEAGADPASVTFIPLPNETLPDAALKGQVDAVLPVSVVQSIAVSNKFKKIGNGSKEFLPGVPQIVWIASKKYVQENAAVVTRFNKAMDEANKYALANEGEIRAIDKELTKLPPAFIDTRVIEPMNIAVDRSVIKRLTGHMKEFGFISKDVPTDDFIWSEAPKP